MRLPATARLLRETAQLLTDVANRLDPPQAIPSPVDVWNAGVEAGVRSIITHQARAAQSAPTN